MRLANGIAKMGLAALLALCGAAGTWALPEGQEGESRPSSSQQPGTALGPKATKREEDAYRAVLDAQTAPAVHLISLGEDFIAEFPMSVYAGDVEGLLTAGYLKANEPNKMMEAGGRALASRPDNVDVLSALAWALPREADATTPQGRQRLQQAAKYARHAIDLLNTMAKPATMDEGSFVRTKNDELAKCYSGLGVIGVKTGQYAEAVTDLTLALHLAGAPGMVDDYLLGVAYEENGELGGALQAFGKCAVAGSPVQNQCQAGASDATQKAKIASPSARSNTVPR